MEKYVKFFTHLDESLHMIIGEETLSTKSIISVVVFSDHTLSVDLKEYTNIDFTPKRLVFYKSQILKFSELKEKPILQNQAFDDFEY